MNTEQKIDHVEKNVTNTPMIGVHSLSEFEFCPRAGIISFGEQSDDPGMERSVSHLDYLPFYELKKLDEEFDRILLRIKIKSAIGLIFLLFAGVGYVLSAFWLSFLILIFLGLLAVQFTKDLKRAWELDSIRNQFIKAPALRLNLENPMPEYVDWRSLLKGNFDIHKNTDVYHDQKLNIRGRPRKILKRGNLWIPVFFASRKPKPRRENSDLPQHQVYQQHYVRIAAYCRLIEANTDFQSPFGIVVFARDYRAIAIKNNRQCREAMERSLTRAREFLNHPNHNRTAAKPSSTALCFGCHYGRPIPHRPGESELIHLGTVVEARSHIAQHDHVHSHCGDMFPPEIPRHENAIKLNLVRTTQTG